MPVQESESWEQVFEQALLEVVSEKMPERVAAVREAIASRLRDLGPKGGDHHSERDRMHNALNSLRVIETRSMKR